ncbi:MULTISPECIES: DUF4123 domain-containing protein [Denitromonas]|uniref:DUF4123 domain-containing protein n=2 Tax=Denitromonas TaxID=139331 RepID=A0A557RR11_9RHOO|nr:MULTISPECIES: DUF4123 domain-containing protein [Denitromonas]TVO59112.1 DUF4123 domain-containing protein [Denitromonas halophila]TVO67606.1 DUF4123 domain-containing protein [Denitromonas ohlonensis]TVO76464.1 DUF4123 domain-containing protein [Denitromonas ohlonensis]
MPRFLQNAHHAGLATQLVQWLAHCADASHAPYALVDMSMLDASAHRHLGRAIGPSTPLLAGGRYAAYGELGPRLFALGAVEASALERLLSLTDGHPALSVLEVATRDGAPECHTLQWLADAQCADDTRLYCRYADTRILPNVLGILDPAQTTRLADTARRWAWVARDGTLQTTNIAPANAAAPLGDETSIRFNDAQFAALMQTAEADTLFDMLNEHTPEIIPNAEPAALWRRLDALLGIARSHGITDAPDQRQFITLAWSASEHFHTLPALVPTFDATRRGTLRFTDALANWDNDIWDQIEAMADASAVASASEPQ